MVDIEGGTIGVKFQLVSSYLSDFLCHSSRQSFFFVEHNNKQEHIINAILLMQAIFDNTY